MSTSILFDEEDIDQQLYMMEKNYNYFELMEMNEANSDLDKIKRDLNQLKRDARSFDSILQRILFDFSTIVVIYFTTFFIGDLINGYFTGKWTPLSRSIWGPIAYLDNSAFIRWVFGKTGRDPPGTDCEQAYEDEVDDCPIYPASVVLACKNDAQNRYDDCTKRQNHDTHEQRQCGKNAEEQYNTCMRNNGDSIGGTTYCFEQYVTNTMICEQGGDVDDPINHEHETPQLRQCLNDAETSYNSCMSENQNDPIGQYECDTIYTTQQDFCNEFYAPTRNINSFNKTSTKKRK